MASEDPTATPAAEGMPAPLDPVGATPQSGLPTTNPPVPSDYTQMGAWWWNGPGPYTVNSGQTLDLPINGICFSPPVRGSGIVRNELTFSFDLVSGSVVACVGVTNPSEYNYPQRPYVGVCYPAPTIALNPGQRVHLIRVDIIDVSQMPADIRSWEMNKGVNGGSGRNAYPSLAPYVTAQGGTAVIQNVQIQSHAVTI